MHPTGHAAFPFRSVLCTQLAIQHFYSDLSYVPNWPYSISIQICSMYPTGHTAFLFRSVLCIQQAMQHFYSDLFYVPNWPYSISTQICAVYPTLAFLFRSVLCTHLAMQHLYSDLCCVPNWPWSISIQICPVYPTGNAARTLIQICPMYSSGYVMQQEPNSDLSHVFKWLCHAAEVLSRPVFVTALFFCYHTAVLNLFFLLCFKLVIWKSLLLLICWHWKLLITVIIIITIIMLTIIIFDMQLF